MACLLDPRRKDNKTEHGGSMEKYQMVKPYPGMVIRESVIFAPGVYNFFGKEGLTITGEGIEINGNGCVFIGGKPKAGKKDGAYSSEFSYGYGKMADDGRGYYGTGIHMENCQNVKLSNVCVRGFERGLFADHCSNCEISENDFSYNYHNPDWGWDEHKDLGGMIFYESHNNRICNNKATDVWSALVLRYCDRNYVHHNNCSHTSNVGLRMWMASHNQIEDNDFSWGLRKEPDEVHARDSSCVLIEASSCHNALRRNDMRYGGDGLFIRSLNNQMSMYNVVEENDMSYANNNAIEAWDSYNTYIRNKASYSSYGFWLGCSDHTVLIENEVIGNGRVFQNAPEAFGNAGVAVVNGSGNDFYLEGNRIEDNSGPGLAVRYKENDPSRNWVLVRNRIIGNCNDSRGYQGHGIYLKHVFGMHLIDNEIRDNEGERIYQDENVSELYEDPPETSWERTEISGNGTLLETGVSYTFSAGNSYDEYRWFTDEGRVSPEKTPTFVFDHCGRVRMRVMARQGDRLATGEKNFYVLPEGSQIQEFTEPDAWKAANGTVSCAGDAPVCLKWKKETHPRFVCSVRPFEIGEQTKLVVLWRYLNDFIDMEGKADGPIVTLSDAAGKTRRIVPDKKMFQDIMAAENEAKYEKFFYEIPLDEKEGYQVETQEGFDGKPVLAAIEFVMPMESTGTLDIYNVRICRENGCEYETSWEYGQIPERWRDLAIQTGGQTVPAEICTDVPYRYMASRCWTGNPKLLQEEWQFDFGAPFAVDALELGIYEDGHLIEAPQCIRVLDENQKIVKEVSGLSGGLWLLEGLNLVTQRLTVVFCKHDGKNAGIWRCRVLKRKENRKKEYSCADTLHLRAAEICLNVEKGGTDAKISDLEYALYESNEVDMLASRLLYRGAIRADQICSGKPFVLDLAGTAVENGKTCHLMLWQKNVAEGIQKGAYYRWPGSGIAPMDGSYGYISQLVVTDRNKTGWGKCYMKLIYDEMICEGIHRSEGMGNRFGLKGMEQIFQKFEVSSKKKFGNYEK